MTIKASRHRQKTITQGPDNSNCNSSYGVLGYAYSLRLIMPATTAGVREFGEFDPYIPLGQLLQCNAQRVSYDMVKHAMYRC